jgi:hypothetical protein
MLGGGWRKGVVGWKKGTGENGRLRGEKGNGKQKGAGRKE